MAVQQSDAAPAKKQPTHVRPSPKEEKRIFDGIVQSKSEYRRQLTELRKSYMEEHLRQQAADAAAKATDDALLQREVAKRKYAKAQRAIANVKRQNEKQAARHIEWQEELRVTQLKREARKERFRKAQQLLVDDLEEEATHWMIHEEEVLATFDSHTNMQHLWARPGMHVGALPSLWTSEDVDGSSLPDATVTGEYFWRYESEYMPMQRSYKSPREYMLEQIQHEIYLEVNIDSQVWTEAKQRAQLLKEDRVRLRALVQKLAVQKLIEQQLIEETNSIEGTKRSALQMYSTGGKNNHHYVPPASFHPIREQWALTSDTHSQQEALEQMEYQVALDPGNFKRLFTFPDAENVAGLPGLLDASRPMAVAPFLRYPLELGQDPPTEIKSQKERKREAKEEEALWQALGGDEGGADAGDDPTSLDGGDALISELKELADQKGEAFESAAGMTATVVSDKNEDDDGVYYEETATDKALSGGTELTQLSAEDVEWISDQLERQMEFIKAEQESEQLAQASLGLTSVRSVQDAGAEGSEEGALVTTSSGPPTLPAADLMEVDTDLYLQAMHLLEDLTTEQKEALHQIDADMNGQVMDTPEDAPRFTELLETTIPSLSPEQVASIVSIELAHLKDNNGIRA